MQVMRSLLIVALLATPVLAGPKIKAMTTDLYPSKKCKTKIAGGEGQDPVLTCPAAVKGYEVEVSFSAIDTHVTVRGDGKETSFSGQVGKKLEWRLADGKPFALLVELAEHGEEPGMKATNQRIAVLAWGESKPATEVALAARTSKALTLGWIKARAAADALVK